MQLFEIIWMHMEQNKQSADFRFFIPVIFVGFIMFLMSCSSEKFPDGSKIPSWFDSVEKVNLENLGKRFNIADFGALGDSITLNTKIIQHVIDSAYKSGGGVILVPAGTFLSGALFFKPHTHLYIEEGGTLKGSDTIADYPIGPSRMEGQNLDYFPALVNAYGVDGFTISGNGIIDGSGLKYWQAFWQRRKENPKCTNLEVSRPRLVFIRNSNHVQIQDVKLLNTGFWTTHFYKCNYIKMLDVYIASPKEPVPAPSSDALDLDVCSNVLVKGCYMSVNDDAITLKGGKGPTADKDTNNGPNTNIIIEDCTFGFCHSVFTCGSEAIHCRNVIVRNCKVDGPARLVNFKMRPDTPQKYEFITLENIQGSVNNFIFIHPWRQFFDLKGGKSEILSVCENITFKHINLTCKNFAPVKKTDAEELRNFTLENVQVQAKNPSLNTEDFIGIRLKNVVVNGQKLEE